MEGNIHRGNARGENMKSKTLPTIERIVLFKLLSLLSKYCHDSKGKVLTVIS